MGGICEMALNRAAIGDDELMYGEVELARAAGFRDVSAPPTFRYVPLLLIGQGRRTDPAWGSTSRAWFTESSRIGGRTGQ